MFQKYYLYLNKRDDPKIYEKDFTNFSTFPDYVSVKVNQDQQDNRQHNFQHKDSDVVEKAAAEQAYENYEQVVDFILFCIKANVATKTLTKNDGI